MNLAEKKAAFAARPIVTAEFHAATQLFDQDEVQRDLRQLRLHERNIARTMGGLRAMGQHDAALGYHFLFNLGARSALDEKLMESFDVPFRCTADYFACVLDALGFDHVASYPDDVPDDTDTGTRSATHIHARPDGLLMVWDEYQGNRSSAQCHFHFVAHNQKSPHPGAGVGGNFERMADGRYAYCGSFSAAEGDGLRAWIDNVLARGAFLSPFIPIEVGSQRVNLVSGHDWTYQVEKHGGRSCDREALSRVMEDIERARFKDIPPWVQEMILPAVAELFLPSGSESTPNPKP